MAGFSARRTFSLWFPGLVVALFGLGLTYGLARQQQDAGRAIAQITITRAASKVRSNWTFCQAFSTVDAVLLRCSCEKGWMIESAATTIPARNSRAAMTCNVVGHQGRRGAS